MERFENKVTIVSESGCWIWTGGTLDGSGDSYGKFYLNGRKQLAHRVSYELYVGPLPDDSYVCHRCDVKCCVNPDHLYAGDAMTNAQDRHTRLGPFVPWNKGVKNWRQTHQKTG